MSRRTSSRRSLRHAFTLMEVLLVLVILVVLAGFLIQNFSSTLEGSKKSQAKIWLGTISNFEDALLGKDQLAAAGDLEPVFLAAVHQDHFTRALQNGAGVEARRWAATLLRRNRIEASRIHCHPRPCHAS